MTSTRSESPRLKSHTRTTDNPRPATSAPAATAGVAPKVAAEGVVSVVPAVRPGPRAGDGRTPVAWLHIVAPPDRRAVPRGTSTCECGRTVTATGREQVLALIDAHAAHREVCPLRHPAQERRQAA